MKFFEKLKSLIKGHASKLIVSAVVFVSITLLSIIAVAANTVPYTVIDGDKTYEVNIIFPEADSLIEKAEEIGLAEVTELDDVIIDENTNTLTLKRAVNVTLDVEGTYTVIHANVGQTLGDALKEANVNTDGAYKVLPVTETVIEGDMGARLTEGYLVTVNGKETEVNGTTVADALNAANIPFDSNDSVTPSIDTELVSGMDIVFVKGYSITVQNGSFTAETSTFALTVEDFLEERQITLGEQDSISLPGSALIRDGLTLKINRVYTVEETVTEVTDYETKRETSIDLYRGGTKVKTPGEKGLAEITYSCTYENGVLVNKEEISRNVLKEAVTEVILEGSKGNYQAEVEAAVLNNSGSGDNYFIDHNGNKVYYKSRLYGEATAYCIPNGITSVGLPVGRGIVAVDPKVIPYGSKLYITNGSYCYGYAIAADTGGAMLSGRVLTDLYMDSIDECFQFGRRDMNIYIIE